MFPFMANFAWMGFDLWQVMVKLSLYGLETNMVPSNYIDYAISAVCVEWVEWNELSEMSCWQKSNHSNVSVLYV